MISALESRTVMQRLSLCVVQKIQLRLQLGVDLPAARKDCFRVRSLRQLQKIIMNHLTKAPPFLRCHIK